MISPSDSHADSTTASAAAPRRTLRQPRALRREAARAVPGFPGGRGTRAIYASRRWHPDAQATSQDGSTATVTVTTSAPRPTRTPSAALRRPHGRLDDVIVTGSACGDSCPTTTIVDHGTRFETGGGFGGGRARRSGTLPEGFTPPDGSVPGTCRAPGGVCAGGGAPAGGRSGPGRRFTAARSRASTARPSRSPHNRSTVRSPRTASTTVQVTKQFTLSDLAVGDTVRVVGTVDGSTVAAQW